MSLDEERAQLAAQLDYIGRTIVSREEMTEAMRDAVTEGLRAVVSDPQFWAAARNAVTQQTKEAAGDIVIDGAISLARKVFWLALGGLAIYSAFGWPAVVAAWKALTAGGKP